MTNLLLTAGLFLKLSFLESNHNDKAIGGLGEVSRYQFRPYVWHSYSSSTNYSHKETADAVAEKHLRWITTAWPLSRPLTDTDVIIIWNKGLTGYKKQGYKPTPADLKRLSRLEKNGSLVADEPSKK